MADLLRHGSEVLCALATIAGPVPLCVWIVERARVESENTSLHADWLVGLGFWLALQSGIGISLGALGLLHVPGLLVAEASLFGLGVGALVSFGRWDLAFQSCRAWRVLPAPGGERLVWAALCFTAVSLLLLLLLRPSEDYDTLMYHLPAVAEWMRTDSLVRLDRWVSISRYAFGWEIQAALLSVPFGEDSWALLPNLIAWVYWGLALFGLGRLLGAPAGRALACTALVLGTPLAIYLVHTANVELALAAFFTAAVYFGLRAAARPSPVAIVLFTVNLGMLCGVKLSAPLYAAAAVVIASLSSRLKVLPASQRPGAFFTPPSSAVLLVSGVALSALVGGFWYLRNWIEFGNPLGFVGVNLFGFTLFEPAADGPAYLRDSGSGSLYRLFEPARIEHWVVATRAALRWLAIGIPVLAVSALVLPLSLWKDLSAGRRRGVLVASLCVACFGLYVISPFTASGSSQAWKLTPWMGAQMRFALPLLSGLAVAASIATRGVPLWLLRATALLGLFYTNVSVLALRKWRVSLSHEPPERIESTLRFVTERLTGEAGAELAVHSALVLSLLVLVVCLARFGFPGRWLVQRWAFVALAFVVLTGGTFLARSYRAEMMAEMHGEIVSLVDRHVHDGDTVAYLASHRSYLFYRRGFGNRVVFAPAPGSSPEQWLEVLRERSATFLAVGPLAPGWETPQELRWLVSKRYRKHFERLGGENPRREPVLFALHLDP